MLTLVLLVQFIVMYNSFCLNIYSDHIYIWHVTTDINVCMRVIISITSNFYRNSISEKHMIYNQKPSTKCKVSYISFFKLGHSSHNLILSTITLLSLYFHTLQSMHCNYYFVKVFWTMHWQVTSQVRNCSQ